MTEKKESLPVGGIDKETAEKEFMRFAQAWRIFTDVDNMTREDRESFDEQKDKIVRAIMQRLAMVDDNGNIQYKLEFPGGSLTELSLKRPSAEAYVKMDHYPDQDKMKKLFAYISEITGQPVRFLRTLDAVDIKFLIGVTNLFLGS